MLNRNRRYWDFRFRLVLSMYELIIPHELQPSAKPISEMNWACLSILRRSNSIKADSEMNAANDRLGLLTFSCL
jgi:hypothetical protein